MYNKIKEIFYRWQAKTKLIHRYEYLNEVNKVLEEYLTEKILQGGSTEFLNKARQDLAQKQSEIKENVNFISFLKNLK
jgi:hypothetical protein